MDKKGTPVNAMGISCMSPEDIEVRVSYPLGKRYVNLLLYKDSRYDTKMFNELYGQRWQLEYSPRLSGYKTSGEKLIPLYQQWAKVSYWDDEIKKWISKEDTGEESMIAAQKGAASDALKRVGFRFGFGVELYSASKCNLSIPREKLGLKPNDTACNSKFRVKTIEYENGKISAIEIVITGQGPQEPVIINWRKDKPTGENSSIIEAEISDKAAHRLHELAKANGLSDAQALEICIMTAGKKPEKKDATQQQKSQEPKKQETETKETKNDATESKEVQKTPPVEDPGKVIIDFGSFSEKLKDKGGKGPLPIEKIYEVSPDYLRQFAKLIDKTEHKKECIATREFLKRKGEKI